MDVVKCLIKNITYPIAMRVVGRKKSLSNYNYCCKKQYDTLENNINDRNDKLYRIVKYAVRYVPYYRDIAESGKLTFRRESIEEDIKQIPLLTKDIIRKEKSRLYSEESVSFYNKTSGGSTGEPVKLRHDTENVQYHPGMYFLNYAGYEIGDKVLLLWGSERDVNTGTIGWKKYVANKFVFRRKFINTFRMTEADMCQAVQILNKWKPKVILGYVQSVYELACYIRRRSLQVHSPVGIVVSAGTLFPDWEKTMQEVFCCKIINQYGSRETSGIACGCDVEDGLHINSFLNYVEIVDAEGRNVQNLSGGEIVVTNLINKSMPLIRYKIGDIGALDAMHVCSCGRGLPKLKYVKGRTVNLFRLKDGTTIDGEYFTHLFYGIEEVKKFQVIQEEYKDIHIKIESNGQSISEEDISRIKKGIIQVMGEDCNIRIEYVEQLLPTPSGKFLYTISRVQERIDV